MIAAPEAIRAGQRAQRRLVLAYTCAFALGLGLGWLIEQGFTALNAARIAGGW